MTSAVRVENGDLVKIARNLGVKNKPAPGWVTENADYQAAYNDGAGIVTPAPAPDTSSSSTPPAAPAAPAKKTARKTAQTRPAARPRSQGRPRPASGSGTPALPSARTTGPSSSGYLSRAFSPSAAAGRLGVGQVASAGDAGGLLLALILYPIVLSTVLYGPDGPRNWFRAKWLNQPSDPNASREFGALGSAAVGAAGAIAGGKTVPAVPAMPRKKSGTGTWN